MARNHLESVGSLFSEEKITEMFNKIKVELETERDKEIEKIKEKYDKEIEKMYGQLKGALVEIHLPEFMKKKEKGGGKRIPFSVEEDEIIKEEWLQSGGKPSVSKLQGMFRNNRLPDRTGGSIRSHIIQLQEKGTLPSGESKPKEKKGKK